MNNLVYSDSVTVLLPTKGRYKVLLDSLYSLSESYEAKNIMNVLILSDQDQESYQIAEGFQDKQKFRSYKVMYSPVRLYPVKAFIQLAEVCTSKYFAFMNDENSYEKDWLVKALARFKNEFPDEVGLLSLYKKKKAGLCLTSKAFVSYNGGEIYNPAYTLYYSDDEMTMRAIMHGRYIWEEYSGVFHDLEITKAVSAIPWEEKLRLKKIDRSIFYRRAETNFDLSPEKIYPWEGFREINMPLK
jgi:hypothetical protein